MLIHHKSQKISHSTPSPNFYNHCKISVVFEVRLPVREDIKKFSLRYPHNGRSGYSSALFWVRKNNYTAILPHFLKSLYFACGRIILRLLFFRTFKIALFYIGMSNVTAFIYSFAHFWVRKNNSTAILPHIFNSCGKWFNNARKSFKKRSLSIA